MRTLKHPPEWQSSCHACPAVLAYTRDDVTYSRLQLMHYITCPHCGTYIEYPRTKKPGEGLVFRANDGSWSFKVINLKYKD